MLGVLASPETQRGVEVAHDHDALEQKFRQRSQGTVTADEIRGGTYYPRRRAHGVRRTLHVDAGQLRDRDERRFAERAS